MKSGISIAACLALGGIASAQWSDDFNRPDGPIGGSWNVLTGTWAIVSNQGAHTSSSPNETIQHSVASLAYDQTVAELDVLAPGSGSQFSGVVIGLGGTYSIMVKIQDQVSGTPGFSNIGIYYSTSPGGGYGAWTGTGTGFGTLSAPFLAGRLKVYFSDPDTLVAEIDTDFNGTPDQTYTKNNVLSFAANLGTGHGIACWGTTALFDNWEVNGGTPPVTNYCTAGTSTNGCNATISASNQPSLTQAAPCVLTISSVEGQKSGIVFYGLAPASGSWCSVGGTSFLCVKAPTQRTITAASGGTIGACDGSIALDWDAYQLGNPSALGNPWLAGAKVYAQGWYRDPPACKTTNMSDAVELTYVP